jgi:hypothetical protein
LAAPGLAAELVQLRSRYVAPAPLSCSDEPTGVLVLSLTPMSVLVRPAAGPPAGSPAAVSTPSYDRSCTSAPLASTRAIPSGAPFWMPSVG